MRCAVGHQERSRTGLACGSAATLVSFGWQPPLPPCAHPSSACLLVKPRRPMQPHPLPRGVRAGVPKVPRLHRACAFRDDPVGGAAAAAAVPHVEWLRRPLVGERCTRVQGGPLQCCAEGSLFAWPVPPCMHAGEPWRASWGCLLKMCLPAWTGSPWPLLPSRRYAPWVPPFTLWHGVVLHAVVFASE